MVVTAAMVSHLQLVQEELSTTRMVQQVLLIAKHVQLVTIVPVRASLITRLISARRVIIARPPLNTKHNSRVRPVPTILKSTKQAWRRASIAQPPNIVSRELPSHPIVQKAITVRSEQVNQSHTHVPSVRIQGLKGLKMLLNVSIALLDISVRMEAI